MTRLAGSGTALAVAARPVSVVSVPMVPTNVAVPVVRSIVNSCLESMPKSVVAAASGKLFV
jgi:hypothetical protein